MRVKTPELA